MNPVQRLIACTAMALASTAASVASAQFVKGNEAVTIKPDGSRVVQTPPLPKSGTASRSEPCKADEGCHGGAWLMVETDAGLLECTEPYARAGSCRASSYGSTRLLRLWVVKSNKLWLQCQRPDMTSKCVDMFSPPPKNLPFPAVQ